MNKTRKIGSLLNAASALVLTFLILLLSAAGASPQLHRLIHTDANAADHNCVITLFAKGQVSAVTIVPISDAFVVQCWWNCPVEDIIGRTASDLRLTPGRAPPAC